MPEINVEVRRMEQSTSSEGEVRGHRLLIDRPPAKGGADRGPMGGELLLVGLGGCFMSTLIAALQARELRVEGLAVTVRGTLEGTPPRYESALVEVRGQGLDAETFDKLITMAERACIVANTLRPCLRLEVRRAPP